jgi:Dolichyl-phosphate-mannose-protein mannosyltransferase
VTSTAEARLRPFLPWVGAALAATLIVWAIDLASGSAFADDVWFVQVLDRVRAGDALYEEVFYGVPPLAVWISLPFTAVLGSELAAVKLVSAAIAVATALVAIGIARRVGVGRYGQALVGLTSIGFITLPSFSPYNPLAYLMLLTCLWTLLGWLASAKESDRIASPWLIAAGVLAGLAVTSKHSVGLLALAASVGAVLLFAPGHRLDLARRLARAAVPVAAAATVTVIVLLPVLLSGSLGDFSSMALDKGEYARSASISYLDGFELLGDAVTDPLGSPRLLPHGLAFVILPISVLALGAAIGEDLRTGGTLGLFLLAAIAGVIPRADTYHVLLAMPMAAIALAWSLKPLAARWPPLSSPVAAGGLAVLVIGCAGLSLFDFPRRVLSHDPGIAGTSPFRGVLLPSDQREGIARMADQLAAVDRGEGRTFLLVPDAAALYLAADVPNPTRFDYPTNAGIRDSDTDLLAEIARGRIDRVCFGSYALGFEPLAPERLIRDVQRTMVPTGGIGPAPFPLPSCLLYRRAGVG